MRATQRVTDAWATARTAARVALVGALVAGCACAAEARWVEDPPTSSPRIRQVSSAAGTVHGGDAHAVRAGDSDTLWIFDADFENFQGDNAGWQTFDMSGSPVVDGDYWHKDTIRINGFEWLGDSTWWCGTYCSWWVQPRGNGNSWAQWLYRLVPLDEWSAPGDGVTLEWDQRYALEHDYDYGYVDISNDYAASWQTVAAVVNNGFAGKPGPSVDWDHINGHHEIDLSEYAGQGIYVRFRVETDEAYSAQDQYDNPPHHSVRDGAWQIDNIEFRVNEETVWLDDCESPGENGWVHHSAPRTGAAGVTFQRLLDPDTFRGFTCGAESGWMMAAVDEETGLFVENQSAALVSPPVDVSGLDDVLVRWHGWVDVPEPTGERITFTMIESDVGDVPGQEAIPAPRRWWSFWEYDAAWGWSDVEVVPDRDWIATVLHGAHYSSLGAGPYTAGLFVDRWRIGTRIGAGEMSFWYPSEYMLWDSFDFIDNWGAFRVNDPDGLASAIVIASADGGGTWFSTAVEPGASGWCDFWIPSGAWKPNTEILYYFEATDSLGNTGVFPSAAPDVTFCVRRLPIVGSEEEPAVLLVDKRMGQGSGFSDTFDPRPLERTETALEVLGYAQDVHRADGPTNPVAYSHYDTHVWLTGDLELETLTETEQTALTDWLAGSTLASPRRLVLIGNDIGHELVAQGADAVGLFPTWLEAEYVDRHPGAWFVSEPDTSILVRDAGLGIMTHDDGDCWIRCGCPDMGLLDVIDALPGGDAQVILEYENGLGETKPAGVVRVDTLTGAAIAIVPFDLARMTEGPASGHADALGDRVSLLGNLLEHMGRLPELPGTGVDDVDAFATALLPASPNPFNPTTTIAFALASPSRVSIRVHDIAGRLVRTLVDDECEAGEHAVVWDGCTDTGDRAASGVYFARMTVVSGVARDSDGADGMAGVAAVTTERRKLVLLK